MENNISTEKIAAAGEDSRKIWSQMTNGAEELQESMECKSGETENDDAGSPIFPPEIFIEILSWLHFRPLARLQLVCKEWRGFIRGRYLTKRNMDRRKVLCHWHNIAWSAENDPEKETFAFIDGCDGLLLMRSFPTMKFSIWNPATCSVLYLPDPRKGIFYMALCYVQNRGNYLVVSLYKEESCRQSCEVLTPGQSESWQPLPFPDVVEIEGRREKQGFLVVPAGEAVHTVLTLKVGSRIIQRVVSLDLETECFTVTSFQEAEFENMRTMFWGLDWNGKLALTKLVGNNLHLTELEDFKKQRWSRQDKIIPLSFMEEGSNDGVNLAPLFAKDGEIWFSFKETVIIVYKIETGSFIRMNTRGLPRAGNMYPYKPTLVSLQGMKPNKFPKCLTCKCFVEH